MSTVQAFLELMIPGEFPRTWLPSWAKHVVECYTYMTGCFGTSTDYDGIFGEGRRSRAVHDCPVIGLLATYSTSQTDSLIDVADR